MAGPVTDVIVRLKKRAEDAIKNNPHSENIINAFMPVLVAGERLIEEGDWAGINMTDIHAEQLTRGVPAIKQTPLFLPGDPMNETAPAMLAALRSGFPHLQDDLTRIEQGISAGRIDLDNYFHADESRQEEVVSGWADRERIGQESLRLFLRTVARTVLKRRACDIAEVIRRVDWDKGYCPVCGAFPCIAEIREKINQRWLHCSQCRHEWRFGRMVCPYCEHEETQGMSYFFVDGKEKETVFICEKCKRYLITLNQIGELARLNFDISAMSLVHLDLLMQEKGFIPMAACEWNVF